MERFFVSFRSRVRQLVKCIIRQSVHEILATDIRVFGDRRRLSIAPSADMANTLFNTESGCIVIGEHSFAGHNVSIITGTHEYQTLLAERLKAIPRQGHDITVGDGVWIGSNAIVLGPCSLGDHSVIGAGSVVLPGTTVPVGAVFAGVPAREVKRIARSLEAGGAVCPP